MHAVPRLAAGRFRIRQHIFLDSFAWKQKAATEPPTEGGSRTASGRRAAIGESSTARFLQFRVGIPSSAVIESGAFPVYDSEWKTKY